MYGYFELPESIAENILKNFYTANGFTCKEVVFDYSFKYEEVNVSGSFTNDPLLEESGGRRRIMKWLLP